MDDRDRTRWESYFAAVLPAALSAFAKDVGADGGLWPTPQEVAERRLRAVREARLFADAALEEATGTRTPALSPADAALLLRFLRKLGGLDGLGEREEPVLDALLSIAEDA